MPDWSQQWDCSLLDTQESTLIIKAHMPPSSDAPLLSLDPAHLSDEVPELSCALHRIDLILLRCACHTESGEWVHGMLFSENGKCENLLFYEFMACVIDFVLLAMSMCITRWFEHFIDLSVFPADILSSVIWTSKLVCPLKRHVSAQIVLWTSHNVMFAKSY